MFHGRISLNSVLQVGIDVYIPHCKWWVKPHSFPWFSAPCTAAIVNRNHFFFICTNKINLLNLKLSSHRLVVIAKGFLKLPNLHMLLKQESITYEKLGSQDFWWIANSVLNKGKSDISPLFNKPEVLSSTSDKAKLFAKSISKNFNIDDSGISLGVFSSRTNLKLHSISISPKVVKKVISSLDSSKASGRGCIFRY